MLDNLEEIELDTLLNKIKEIKTEGDRMLQICATKLGDVYEILYSISVPTCTTLPSMMVVLSPLL